MIETTHIRLTKAAEILKTDVETLLIAATEGRIKLYGLLNQIRRVTLCEWIDDLDFPEPFGDATSINRFIRFAPLTLTHAAGLLACGETGEFHSYDDDEAPFRFVWRDEGDNPATSIPERLIFALAADVQKIKDAAALPDPDSARPVSRPYISDHLAWMQHAARKFWENADRDDPTTHPSNETVAEWLQDNGLPKSRAEQAASLIRPKWAHNGRKPES